ncbi:MAG: MmgE/PrpD family protein [Burkholderiales bacterium]
MNPLDQIAHFVATTHLADIPMTARDRMGAVFADCIACTGAGMQAPVMRELAAVHRSENANGHASVIGAGRYDAPREASFLNATAGVWHDYDEGNLEANGHPGIQCVPAALAYAEQHGLAGADLLLASTLGYEVAARVGRAANLKVIVHPHGTFGAIGAAVACARLAGLDAARIRSVINIAASLANASNRNTLRDGATVRNVYAGHANEAGLLAVRLAQAGISGERDGLSTTFGAVLGDRFNSARLVDGLGDDWLASRGYFKLHANGRFLHSAVDAMLDLLAGARRPIRAEHVQRIEIETFHYAARLDNTEVDGGFGAKFSIPFALATTLVHGRADLDCFNDAAAADDALRGLSRRVIVRENPAFTAAFPAQQISMVVVMLDDGTRLAGRCDVMQGEPANPHPAGAHDRKLRSLAEPIWGAPATTRLLEGCQALATIVSVSDWAASIPLIGPVARP